MRISTNISNINGISATMTGVNAVVRSGIRVMVESTMSQANHPEQTGFAKASWFSSVDGVPSQHPSPPTRVGRDEKVTTKHAINTGHINKAAAGGVFSLNNTADYIYYLETRSEGEVATGRAGWIRAASVQASNAMKNKARSL